MTADIEQLVARAKARVGSVVNNKWRLDSILGVGGMATVFAGTHRNGKRGAVKVLHTEAALEPQLRARFLREGYVANKIEHPGVVNILDDDEAADGTVYLVMELLDGDPLDVRYEESRMGFEEALIVADQLLDVLAAAHEKGIIHRDLKPGNVFLTRDGRVKVLDFGIARAREAAGGTEGGTATTLFAMGTPGFMAPEQARGLWDEVDGRSDLWAVGATLFTLLTGRAVHEERTMNEQLLAGMTKEAPRLSTVLPSAPEPLAEIVDRALAFERTARWSSADEMRVAVRAAYESIFGRSIEASAVVSVSRGTPGSRPVVTPHPLFSTPTALEAESRPRVSQDAVTVAQPSIPVPAPGAKTMEGTALAARGPQRRPILLAAGAAVLVATVLLFVARPAPPTAPASASPVRASAPPLAVSAPPQAPPPAPVVEPPPPAAPAPAPSTAAAPPSPRQRSAPRPAARPALATTPAPNASPAASPPSAPPPAPPPPPPPPTVDLYGRRK